MHIAYRRSATYGLVADLKKDAEAQIVVVLDDMRKSVTS